jgi:DNA invertase Pin-like site-specific DNA recombinase
MAVTAAKLSKSEQIRRMFDAGMSVAEIANSMQIRYQFAYNVISYHIKTKGGVSDAPRTDYDSSIHRDVC